MVEESSAGSCDVPCVNDDADVLAAGNVTVYSAAALEHQLIQKVERDFTEDSTVPEASLAESLKLPNLFADSGLSSFVKHGDMTPFEVLHQSNSEISDTVSSELKDSANEEVNKTVKLKREKSTSSVSDSDFVPENEESESSEQDGETEMKHGAKTKRQKKSVKKEKKMGKERDDANDEDFQKRLRTHLAGLELLKIESGENEMLKKNAFHELKNDVKVPLSCWKKLYKYQKTGVRWLTELHDQCVGGILADEMGLGKTIQVITFLQALAFSNLQNQGFSFSGLGPVLIICPATLMHQWLNEFHTWFPLCRVAVLHSSGSFHGQNAQLIRKMIIPKSNGSVLLTSYGTFTKNHKQLVDKAWHYVILDEGHKIRNPNAQVTLAVKELHTPHRLILSGSPLQNSLRELWSLVDFVYPGRLGSLKSFMDKFAVPITQGGYANATAVQVRTAYKCACILRDAISPYLLRRLKKDVEMSIQLPTKTEQILFCDITSYQRSLYQEYLSSRECDRILTGKIDPFIGIMTLRKLCNHPDLVTGGSNKFRADDIEADREMEFGAYFRSGKMQVLRTLLRLWRRQKHKVLLFSQSRQMLTILEKFVIKEEYSYLRMDGTTPVGKRQRLVEEFNKNSEVFIFLLTTRVGGLGINLTGANRVLIFDPDWNPSTDIQARERAWRIGQERAVTIYRLLTGGTIEEKIYHRQIFKVFLSNRVLIDPRQRRFFKTNDLHELFSLGDDETLKKRGTETAAIFTGVTKNFTRHNFFDRNEKDRERKRKELSRKRKKSTTEMTSDDDEDARAIVEEHLSAAKISELKKLARKISRSIAKRVEERTENENKNNRRQNNKDDDSSINDMKIPYLKKKRRYKEKKMENPPGQDDYVLKKLLANAGVISALQHDQIFAEGIADDQLIEDEANAVAAKAAASLRRSRRILPRVLPDGPRFGARKAFGFEPDSENDDDESKEPSFSGAALLKGKIGSGGSLLDAIRKRKQRTLDVEEMTDEERLEECYPSLIDASAATSSKKKDKHEKLAEDLRLFIMHRKGQALTDEILQSFKNRVSVEDSFAFRSILKRLCVLQKGTNLWILKDEFR